MKRMLLAAASLVAIASPVFAKSEYALLAWSGDHFSWTDSRGVQRSADSPTLFADLSTEAAAKSHLPQAEILVLDGLAKQGWEIAHASDAAGTTTFLLKRTGEPASAALSAGTSPGIPSSASTSSESTAAPSPTATADGQHVPVTFTGGHDTDPRDGGRPVILIANALGVPAESFRETFTHVHPAHNDGGPTDAEARANKQALMAGLSPYGVTDDRLNEVSNYYRYRRQNGELWTHRDAAAYAVVKDGKVQSVVITDGGAGYSSPPTIAVPGVPDSKLTAEVAFAEDLKTNGAIKSIANDDASDKK